MFKVLAVDNDLLFLDFIRDLLEEAGHAVKTAPDGVSALNVLETFSPDFIFVDLIMPNIDGKRLCRIIRKMEHLNHSRIIILSAAAMEESLDIPELGVEMVITKGPLEDMAKNILKLMKGEWEPSLSFSSGEMVIAKEIRQRKITEELLDTKKHFELILERMTEGVLEITSDGRIVYANKVACTLTGLPEEVLLGIDFLQLFHTEDRVRLEKKLKGDPLDNYTGEDILTMKEYQVTVDLLEIKEEGKKHIVILNNVTERKKLEESLIQSERLAATGQLAASIAHQINSPLQGITAILSVMKEARQDDPDLSENIQLLDGAFNSIRDTVRKLQDLNRPGQEEKQPVSVHKIITDTVSLVGSRLRQSGIKTSLDFCQKSDYLTASPQQLEYVFLNLVNNAIEAINAQDRNTKDAYAGEIAIRTEVNGDFLVVEITDSGPGIPDEALSRIFDAFYTRKGKLGMGMGLAVCRAVIERHKGTIEAGNQEGSGALFRISLPFGA
jgi:PAS domain S-box-containing protein